MGVTPSPALGPCRVWCGHQVCLEMTFQSCWQPSNFNILFFSSLKKVKDRSEARRGQNRDKPMASDTLFCSGLLERLVWKWDMLKCPI